MILGLLVAVVVPVVGSYFVLSNWTVDENGAALGDAMSMFGAFSNWSACIGLGMLLIGGLTVAMTLSGWFLRHNEKSNSTS